MSGAIVEWIKQQPFSTTADDYDPKFAVDSAGNIIVAFVTLGASSGNTNKGSADVVLVKFNSAGTVVWVKQPAGLNTAAEERNPKVVTDSSNNIYVAYSTAGTITGGTAKGSFDSCVAKLDSDGTVLWAKQYAAVNTSNWEDSESIVIDSSGNLYIGYNVLGTVSGGTASGSVDAAVYKLDSNGNLLWVKQFAALSTAGNDSYTVLSIDSSNNLYGCYQTNGTVSGGTSNASSWDIAVFKMDSNGNLLWIRQNPTFNTSAIDQGPKIRVGPNGDVYVCYYTTGGTVSGGTATGGTNDVVVFKLNSSGTLSWTRQMNTMSTPGNDVLPTIAVDTLDNVYVSYYTDNTISGGTSSGGNDIAIFKMNSSGTVLWNIQRPAFNTSGSDEQPWMALSSNNGLYLTYRTTGVVSGGAATGSGDIVVAKLYQAPEAPTAVTVDSVASGSATVSWTAPTLTGGAAITGYTVTSSPGGFTATGASGPLTVTGLTNGTSYTFTVTASNGLSSAASAASASALVYGAPSAPTAVTVDSVGDGSAVVSWTAPASNNGKAITGYTVTSSPDGFTATGASGPLTVTGLTNGNGYTFTVTATNGKESAASDPSDLVIPYTTPDAPQEVSVVAVGDGSAIVSWLAPASNGGKAIDSYTVTSSPGEFTATGSTGPLTVTGLTNGTSYTFTATAFNGLTSAASTPSASKTLPVAPGAPTGVTVTEATNGRAVVSWTAPTSDGGAPILSYTVTSSPGGFTVTGASSPLTVVRLTNGTTYTFTVTAYNGLTSTASAPSASATPTLSTINIQTYAANPATPTETVSLDVRAFIQCLPTADKAAAKADYVASLRTKLGEAESFTVTTSNFDSFTSTLDTVDSNITPKDISVFVPTIVGSRYRVNVDNIVTDGSSYTQFEMVQNTPMDFYEAGALVATLYYTGTALYNYAGDVQGAQYAVGETLALGTKFIKLFGFGTVFGDSSVTEPVVEWVRQTGLNTAAHESNPRAAVDPFGNIYVAYSTQNTLTGQDDIVVAKLDASNNLIWVKSIAGLNTNQSEYKPSIGCDSLGNVYLTFNTSGSIVGRNWSPQDRMIAKLDANGNVMWRFQESGASCWALNNCAVDGTGNLAVAYEGLANFGGTYSGNSDIVIKRYNSNGTVAWTRQAASYNTSAYEISPSVAFGSAGNVIIAYATGGTVSGGTRTGNQYNIAIVAYDFNGQFLWVKQSPAFNSNSDNAEPVIKTDSQGNIYCAYRASGTVPGGTKTTNAYSVVVFKMDSNGDLLWIRQDSRFCASNGSFNPAIILDNQKNVYVSFHANGNIPGGVSKGSFEIIMVKFNSSGILLWTSQNPVINTTGHDFLTSMAMDTNSGNLYLAYNTQGAITGATNTNQSLDVVIAKIPQVGPPGAPTGAIVTSIDNGQAVVSFTPPTSNGGKAITGYTVRSSPGGITATGTSSPITVPGLLNGTAYTFTVTATNGIVGPASAASSAATPFTNPGAPTATAVTSVDNRQAIVSFTPPASDGGKAITGYTVTSSPGGITATGTSTPITVTGLENGTAYTFTVTANNGKLSSASSASASATPFTNPGAPTATAVTSVDNGQAIVSFTPPASDGGKAISSYTVTSSPGGITATGSSSPITVTGLENGTAYTFTVRANNGKLSSASSASAAATPFTNPGAPTAVTVNLAANGRAVVSWTQPSSDGGKTITGYTVTSSPGGLTASGSSSPLTITGLDPATSYTFTVTASNGLSTTSAASAAVTPAPALTVAANGAPVPEISSYVSLSTKTIPEIAVDTRTLLKSLSGNAKKGEKVNYVQAFREKIQQLDNFIMPTNLFAAFIDTLETKTTDTLATKETRMFIPKMVGSRFTIYVDTLVVDDTAYNHFEMPIDVPVQFCEGTTLVRTLCYDGSKLYDYPGDVKGAEIPIGQPITLGTKTTTLLGLGSVFMGPGPSGGGVGDPYIKTVSGDFYKLPTMDGAIRFYQGEVDGETLTVNATLKTISSAELAAYNLRSLIDLSAKLGKKRTASAMKKLFESEETLCFFEKVYISHKGREIVLDVWDSKIKVESHKGVFPMKVKKNGEDVLKATEIYAGYSGATLELTVGEGAKVSVSAFESPIVRSGLLVDAPAMGSGNGVIVNALSKADMTLDTLRDVKPVARADSMVRKTIKESFIDKSGTRVRNIVVLK